MAKVEGTAADPWKLKTPPLTSEFTMHRDTIDGVDLLVCTVGKTILHYEYRCLKDLHAMLKAHGDWMELGSADEQKPAKPDTVEAWGRSPKNPVGGWREPSRARRPIPKEATPKASAWSRRDSEKKASATNRDQGAQFLRHPGGIRPSAAFVSR